MKNLFLGLIVLFSLTTTAYASFPVNKQKVIQTEVNSSDQTLNQGGDVEEMVKGIENKKPEKVKEGKSRMALDEWVIQLLLLVFLGFVAGHRWYARKPIIWNLLFIITLGGFGLWYLIDLIYILQKKF